MHCCMLTVRAGTVIVKSKTRPTYFGPGYTKLGISESKCHRCFLPLEKQKYIEKLFRGHPIKTIGQGSLDVAHQSGMVTHSKEFCYKNAFKIFGYISNI